MRYNRAFVDIDTQVDFMEAGGKLYVPGAEGLREVLGRLVRYAGEAGIPVISSADDHPEGDPEFERFPPHCVRGTAGQKKIPETTLADAVVIGPEDDPPGGAAALLERHRQLVFHKTTFDPFSNPHFERLIERLEVGIYVVFGVATDYCVKAAAKGLLERGKRTAIVRDAVRPVTAEGGEAACRMLSEMGVEWVEAQRCLTQSWESEK